MSIPHQSPTRTDNIARQLWRVGVTIIIVLCCGGVLVGVGMIYSDLSESGEKFDGLLAFFGAVVAAASALMALAHFALLRAERQVQRLPVVVSAVLPIGYLATNAPSMARFGPYDITIHLFILTWVLLCGFLVASRSTEFRTQ